MGDHNQVRYNFVAGPYTSITANGGERHHFVASNSIYLTGWNTSTAPAIRMIYRDHLNTPNWGNGTTQTLFRSQEVSYLRAGQYQTLLQMEVDGLKASPDSEGTYSNLADKYYDQLIYSLYLAEQYFGIS